MEVNQSLVFESYSKPCRSRYPRRRDPSPFRCESRRRAHIQDLVSRMHGLLWTVGVALLTARLLWLLELSSRSMSPLALRQHRQLLPNFHHQIDPDETSVVHEESNPTVNTWKPGGGKEVLRWCPDWKCACTTLRLHYACLEIANLTIRRWRRLQLPSEDGATPFMLLCIRQISEETRNKYCRICYYASPIWRDIELCGGLIDANAWLHAMVPRHHPTVHTLCLQSWVLR